MKYREMVGRHPVEVDKEAPAEANLGQSFPGAGRWYMMNVLWVATAVGLEWTVEAWSEVTGVRSWVWQSGMVCSAACYLR